MGFLKCSVAASRPSLIRILTLSWHWHQSPRRFGGLTLNSESIYLGYLTWWQPTLISISSLKARPRMWPRRRCELVSNWNQTGIRQDALGVRIRTAPGLGVLKFGSQPRRISRRVSHEYKKPPQNERAMYLQKQGVFKHELENNMENTLNNAVRDKHFHIGFELIQFPNSCATRQSQRATPRPLNRPGKKKQIIYTWPSPRRRSR